MLQNILVSGIGKRNALLNLLRRECRARELGLFGCDAIAGAPARIAVDGFDLLPVASDATFADNYAAIVQRENAVGYLTLIDPEIVPLGEMEKAGVVGAAKYLHPVSATASICEDKYRFYEHLEAHGITGIPTFLEPLDCFPFIRKDRTGSAASGFRVYRNSDEASKIHDDADEDGRFIYQPFCHGRHYCVDAYFSVADGGLVDFCVKEVLSKQNGESYLLRSVDRSRFSAVLQAVAAALPMRGIVNVDVYDEDGVLKVMEVNCRIGGNYPASHAFGCNLIAAMLDDLLSGRSRSTPALTPYSEGQFVAKYFDFSPPFDAMNGIEKAF